MAVELNVNFDGVDAALATLRVELEKIVEETPEGKEAIVQGILQQKVMSTLMGQ